MTRCLLGLAALTVAVSWSDGPARAQVGDAPWCAVVNMGRDSVYWDCHYRTFEQCVPNVLAGNRGFCNMNPRWEGWYAPVAKPPRPSHHRKRHSRAN